MDWLSVALYWYVVLFILGLVFFPVTRKLFSHFYDGGYPFSKTIAILVLSYSAFLFGTLKILPFTQLSLFFLIILFGILSFSIAKKNRVALRSTFYVLLFEELLFLVSFLFLAYVRGQEPSIRGLEKFMDFGFVNSILRAKFFPPLDMWLSSDPTHLSGYPINYYYFGHLTGAFLIKLTGVKASIGYNLILATIFAQGITLTFSLTSNLVYLFQKLVLKLKVTNFKSLVFFGLLGSYIVNLGGNLHTIYLFTTGYPNETPVAFWKILSSFNPAKYWYPNATRFIPFTIHEFPSYSYVVADLHGHVFDIPFVLLTLAILLILLVRTSAPEKREDTNFLRPGIPRLLRGGFPRRQKILVSSTLLLGFMIAVHYMTNAFDGPIYFLLLLVFFLSLFGITSAFFTATATTLVSFIIFSLLFTSSFKAFVSGIGLNCAPDFLVNLGRIGPFLFEKDKCQVSPLWMLFVLWGFFIISFLIFLTMKYKEKGSLKKLLNPLDKYVGVLFLFGIFLVIIPEFFYIKDIYPAHFRANTMFKLGYQAFMIMGIASSYTFYRISHLERHLKYLLESLFLLLFFFIFLYPFFSFRSYYGDLKKNPQLDGSIWLKKEFPQDAEIIEFINKKVAGQPVILEAQGDSYTDYERISAYTGLPTIAGWWVHEWLWRGSSDVVGKRILEIEAIYESQDKQLTKDLLRKYSAQYVVVSGFEKEKYQKLSKEKFEAIGDKIFESKNHSGALYQLK